MTELHVDRLLTPLALPSWVWEQLEPESSSESGGETSIGSVGLEGLFVPLGSGDQLDFDELSDLLLLEVLRKLTASHGRLSIRTLAKTINMSRGTLSARIKGILHKNLATPAELASIVNSADKLTES
jgi:hypothetical protein